MNQIERKTIPIIELKELDSASNKIYGHCSVKGNIDDYNDVVLSGAYSDIDKSLYEGFICPNHEWDNPIGWFTVLREDEIGLYFEAEFHSTEEAIKWKTICMERLGAGKFVGLSIGYLTLDYEMGMKDGISVRFLKKILVKEATITLLPANEEARVVGMKSKEHFTSVKSSLVSYMERTNDIWKKGRGANWIKDRMSEIQELKSILSNHEQDMNSLEDHPDDLDNAEVLGTEAKSQTEVEVKPNELDIKWNSLIEKASKLSKGDK